MLNHFIVVKTNKNYSKLIFHTSFQLNLKKKTHSRSYDMDADKKTPLISSTRNKQKIFFTYYGSVYLINI